MLTLARWAASITPWNIRCTAGGTAMPSENRTRLLRPGSRPSVLMIAKSPFVVEYPC
jgi:hypothetical protein